MNSKIEYIEANRDFWFKLYYPGMAGNLIKMPSQTGNVTKDDINVEGGGMIAFFQSAMQTKAMALRIIPENQAQPEFEEFYPTVYFGEMRAGSVKPYGFFAAFAPHSYDVVVDEQGKIHFGAKNLKTILDLPSRKTLVDRYTAKHGKAPEAQKPKPVAHMGGLPSKNAGGTGYGRDDDVPF